MCVGVDRFVSITLRSFKKVLIGKKLGESLVHLTAIIDMIPSKT